MAHERETDAAEVGTAAETADDDVWIFTRHFHLFLGFQPDDGLVQGDVAQYATRACICSSGSCVPVRWLRRWPYPESPDSSGVLVRMSLPARVDMEGEAVTCAPNVCMMLRR